MTHNKAFTLGVASALLFAACTGGASSDTGTLPTAPPTAATTETAPRTTPPTSSSTTSSTTSQPGTSVPTATLPPGVVGLSPDGPWRQVDSAPGITTPGLFYELMPKLWVYLPLEQDIDNGILATFSQDDAPIIEAYLQARLTYFRATQRRPIDLADAGWDLYYTDGGASFANGLTAHSDRGEVLDLDAGVVLRPEVLGDDRTDTYAIVYDCFLDGATWRLPDGSLGEGSTLGTLEHGSEATAVLVDGAWAMERVANQPRACS